MGWKGRLRKQFQLVKVTIAILHKPERAGTDKTVCLGLLTGHYPEYIDKQDVGGRWTGCPRQTLCLEISQAYARQVSKESRKVGVLLTHEKRLAQTLLHWTSSRWEP